MMNKLPDLGADVIPILGHPWQRWCARTLDWGLCRLALTALLCLGLRVLPPGNLLVQLALNYLTWGLIFLTEPLLLSTWGATPGKWLMGLSIRDGEGRKLTLRAAFDRTTQVFVRGCGCGIPIYEWYRNYRGFLACGRKEALPWEEGLTYRLRDEKPLRVAGFVCGEIAVMVLSLYMALGVLLPPVRGPLTVAGYARNYNDLLDRYGGPDYYLLDETGAWERNIPPGTFVVGGENPPPPLQYTLTDGAVTAVTVEYDTEPGFLEGDRGSQVAMVMALLGAQREVTPWNLSAVVRTIPEEVGRDLESYSVTFSGLTVTNEVSYSGYDDFGGVFLIPKEGEEQSYRQVFKVEIAQ